MKRTLRTFLALVVFVVNVVAFARVSWGVILYGSANRNTSAPTGALAGSGWQYEGNWGAFLGTAIAPQYFIAAKHVGGSVGDSFVLNSVPYTTIAKFDSPTADLTIWQISGGIPTSQIAPLYPSYGSLSPSYEVNKNIVIFGRGTQRGGGVLLGGVLHGWYWGAADSLESWGENNVSAIATVSDGKSTGPALQFDFSRNDYLAGATNEATLSIGDSSGGVFIKDPSDNVWKLAGINWALDASYSTASGSGYFSGALFDRGGFYQNGQLVPDLAADNPQRAWATQIGDTTNTAFINSITVAPVWVGLTGGNWSSAANWSLIATNGANLIFAGPRQTVTNDNALFSANSITFNSTAGAFSLGGSALTLSGGITNYSANTQTINLNLTLSAAQQFNAANGNLAIGGAIASGGYALTVTGSANTTISGGISGAGNLTKNGAGTLTLSGNNSYSGTTSVSTGTLIAAHPHALGSGSLTINNTATVQLQPGLSQPVQLASLTIAGGTAPTAKLDITNNNLIVHNGSIATIVSEVKSGLNASGVRWTGLGITSSTAASGSYTAVGVILNSKANGAPIYNSWPGTSGSNGAVPVSNTDVLMKYTYYGDANLDGVVDNTSDYDLWSQGFANPGLVSTNGWLYGDFNYDGVVDNTSDLDLWSTGLFHQSTPLAISAVQPVPEPVSLALAASGMAILAVILRRRVRRGYRDGSGQSF